MTTDDKMALSSFQVLDLEGSTLQDTLRREELAVALKDALCGGPDDGAMVSRRLPRHLKHFPTATEVAFTPDTRNHRTVMRLTTLDRPGLLAEVGAVFEECSIRLQNAKIATVGAEVDDVFFITTQDETAITCETALTCLRRAIHRRLESSPDA
jgi:[protein-PII] uridylyltransferase